jgi:hypothetical protein
VKLVHGSSSDRDQYVFYTYCGLYGWASRESMENWDAVATAGSLSKVDRDEIKKKYTILGEFAELTSELTCLQCIANTRDGR